MSSLSSLIKYTYKYKLYIVLSIVAMTFQVVTGFLIPSYLKVIIDEAIPLGDQTLLLRTGGIMVLIAFIGLALGIANNYTSQKVALFATTDLRNDLFQKIQSLSAINIDKFKTSRLVTTATNDITRIQTFFQMLLRIIVRAPLMVGIGLFMALRTSLELSNIFFISIPLLLITIGVIVVIAFPLFSKVQLTIDGLNKVSLETANSPRVIKSFVSMEHENKRFEEANQLFRKTNLAAEKVMVFAEPLIMLIFNASLAGIILLGSYYISQGQLQNVINGETIPAVGVLIAFNNYMMQILFGLMMFAMVLIFVSRALASAKRIQEVLDEEIDLQNCIVCIHDFEIKGDIEFRNVSFHYQDEGNNVLSNLSFKVKAGQRVGIIGSTGSGKSSLISLIPRLYDVTEGDILIDGKNIKQLNITQLRKQISLVTQTATIYSGSIATNILQGKQDGSLEDLERAAKSAQAMEFIETYKDYFNHTVQQKGTNFSGGQKQRISLARAFVRNPKILILDDSTSAVDAKSEERILQEIDQLSNRMTTLVISQKISTIRDMDAILVLNNKGMIDGYGTHQELLDSSHVYQEIALSQIGTGGDLDA
jgi:ATP-binding cassette subfamily B protein